MYDRVGQYYQGTVNVTESGESCQSWASRNNPNYNPTDFPENSTTSARNYCRNPTNDKGGPWCWVNQTRMGYCTLPICRKYYNDLKNANIIFCY